MKRTPIDLYEWLGPILQQLPQGVLLSSHANGEDNTMTIGWMEVGRDWSIPVLTVFVRQSRHTKKLLDASGEFTINAALPQADVRKVLGYCGTKSGRDGDKFAAMGLHKAAGEQVKSPAIAELPVTIECKVLYVQDQDLEKIPEDLRNRYYADGDFHTAYTAKILNTYLLEEE